MERQLLYKTRVSAGPNRKMPSSKVNFNLQGQPTPIQNLQRFLGNQAFGQMIHAKLKINQPGDKYEQQADRVAEQVMRMPASEVSHISQAEENLQRKCAGCEDEEEMLQRKEQTEASVATPALRSQLVSTKGGGSSLPHSTQSFMNQVFGVDLRQARVHTDAKAVKMNQGLNARAFTHGSDIYFNQGQYSPDSSEGKRLIAHELTHVAQQGHAQGMRNAAQLSIHSAKGMIQRQPGPPSELPKPTICSVVFKNGLPHVKCDNLPTPGLKNTPDIPLTPEGWRVLRDKIFKSDPKKPVPKGPFPGNTPFDPKKMCDLAPDMFPDICRGRLPGQTAPPQQLPKKPLPGLPPLRLPELNFPNLRNLRSTTLDHFEVDQSTLPGGAEKKLQSLIFELNMHLGTSVFIDGHADQSGPNEHNDILSVQRATEVKNTMIKLGLLNPDRIVIEGHGERELLHPKEQNAEEKAQNRRVEVFFVIPLSTKPGPGF